MAIPRPDPALPSTRAKTNTYETNENAFLNVPSVHFACGLFSSPSPTSVPLVFNMLFRDTMNY